MADPVDQIQPADRQVEEIESLCMNCHADGTTRLLLTRIPFFRDVVLMSFSCPSCGFKNSEIQNAGEIQQRGVKYAFRIENSQDLQRQIVKGDSCVVKFEEIDLEIPAGRGQLTNVEGLLGMVADDLGALQEERKKQAPEVFAKVHQIIISLEEMSSATALPFTLTLDDPSGNSSIEPNVKDVRGKWVRSEYARTPEQNEALGLAPGEVPAATSDAPATEIRPEYRAQNMVGGGDAGSLAPNSGPLNADDLESGDIEEGQVYEFPTQCPGCTRPCAVNMKMVRIPHFEEVVIMAVSCDACGYRSSDVKTGGAIPEKGQKITVQIKTREDLSRDILKGEHCALSCPELNLNVEPGTLGGRFTTIEGILSQIRDDLKKNIFDTDAEGKVTNSDSMPSTEKSKWNNFFSQLDTALAGSLPFTLIMEDPIAKSYVQSFAAPEPDPQIQVVDYKRTAQEEEDLGLNDIQTEGYEQEAQLQANATQASEAAPASNANGTKPEIDVEEVQREVHAQLAGLDKGENDVAHQ